MLTKNYVAKNGAATTFHDVKTIYLNLPSDVLLVIVHSFSSTEDLIAGASPTYASDPIPVPRSALPVGEIVATVEAWLATDPASPFAGATVTALVGVDLAAAKLNRLAYLKAQRNAVMLAGFTFNGARFDSDLQAQIFIQGAAQLATLAKLAGQSFEVQFTRADETTVPLNGDDVIALGQALGKHIIEALQLLRVARAAVDAATTVEEVALVNLATLDQ